MSVDNNNNHNNKQYFIFIIIIIINVAGLVQFRNCTFMRDELHKKTRIIQI